MGGDEGRSQTSNRSVEEEKSRGFSKNIKFLYNSGLQLGLNYFEMYSLDYEELQNTIIEKRKGLANDIWRLGILLHHPFVKNYPETPEEAFPDLYPPKPTILMPEWMKEKWLKQKGVK